MSFFSLVSILISLAAISSFVNYRYIKLPTTVGVMLVGLIASLTLVLAAPYTGAFREQTATLISQFDFSQVVLHGMLAFLLFASAIHVHIEDLAREWLSISLLAIFGTLISTCVVGAMTWLILGWLGLGIPIMHALVFGALISPTDPIAVMGIMKSVGASRQIEAQVAGESLFNDGLGVVVFLLFLRFAFQDTATPLLSVDIGAVAILLLKEVGGALLLGLAAGIVTYQMLKRVDNYQVEILLTLALAMGIFALAEGLLLSAPIAVVVAGLFVGNRGRAFAMTAKTREHVDSFWELVDEILNVILFLLIGLELLVLPFARGWLVAGALAIPIVLSARWLSVAGIIGPLGRVTTQSRGAISSLTWGGLRGGISVAMALSLPASSSRSLVLTLTYFVVIFSILVQGMTLSWVIRKTSGATEAPQIPPSP